jgi:hypothetical protein
VPDEIGFVAVAPNVVPQRKEIANATMRK